MDKVIYNRQTRPMSFKKSKNLGQLIALAEKEGEAAKVYITKLKLNGELMKLDDESLLEWLSINEVETLEVYYSSMEDIVKNSISHLVISLQNIQLIAAQLGQEFRSHDKFDKDKLDYLLIQCRNIMFDLEEIFKAHSGHKFLLKHFSLWFEAEKELSNILQCILRGRGITTTSFLADLIEYDLVHALGLWDELLEKELIDNPRFNGIFKLKSPDKKRDNGVDA